MEHIQERDTQQGPISLAETEKQSCAEIKKKDLFFLADQYLYGSYIFEQANYVPDIMITNR